MLKNLLRTLSLASALTALCTTAAAEQAPVPPLVKMIVPFAPGASTDVIGRAIASQLGPRLGSNVIVENKPGASGFIGASAVANGPKDGSSLLFVSVSLVSAAASMKKVPVDVMKELVPVAILGEGPLVFAVTNGSKIHTPAELIAAARAQPDVITHGTGGIGTIAHMGVELLNDAAKIQLKHIPYRGASLAVTDMIGGSIDSMLAVNTTFASQVNAGRVRLIGITSLQPSAAFPDVPTFASVVPGFEVNLWTAVFAPAGTPPAVVQRLNQAINEIGKSRQLRELMLADGGLPVSMTPDQAADRVRESYAVWRKLATDKNIVLE